LKSILDGLIIVLAVCYNEQGNEDETYRAEVERIEDEVKRLEDKVKRLEDEINTAETFANAYQLAYEMVTTDLLCRREHLILLAKKDRAHAATARSRMGGLKSIQEGLKDKIIELAVRYIVQEIVEDTYRADVRRIEDEVKRLEDKVKRLEDKVKRLEDEINTAETFANTYQLAY
jgi:uncharacterized protein YlxW (UPF0749 family)